MPIIICVSWQAGGHRRARHDLILAPGTTVRTADALWMVLTCPACATRYRVAAREFETAAERTVRCANCGHLWRETNRSSRPGELREPSPEAEYSPLAPSPQETRQASVASISPFADRPPGPLPRPPHGSRGSARKSWLIAAALLIVGVIAAIFYFQHGAAVGRTSDNGLHASASPVSPPASGLVIRKVVPQRTAEGLVVAGEIANLMAAARKVPQLRLVLQDSAEREVQSKIIDPPEPMLPPGGAEHFETRFIHPPDAASGVVVMFATP